jgi:hypothetical protein
MVINLNENILAYEYIMKRRIVHLSLQELYWYKSSIVL